jgi:hypothetical protein
MVKGPLTCFHHPNFHPIDPSSSTDAGAATITPRAPNPPTQSFPSPYEFPEPKSASWDTQGVDPRGPAAARLDAHLDRHAG